MMFPDAGVIFILTARRTMELDAIARRHGCLGVIDVKGGSRVGLISTRYVTIQPKGQRRW
jgi:hypothetical protein